MERARAKFVGCQAVLWALVFFMVLPTLLVMADTNVNNPDDDESTVPRLFFEPIAGLTTTRHLAPGETAIPLGTVLELYLEVPGDAQVSFAGATVTSRTSEGISATCLLNQVGPAFVAAISVLSDGTRSMAACRLDVVSIAINDISATVTTPTVAPFDLGENATNAETMSYYFGGSIADLMETTTQVSGAVGLDGGRRRPRSASSTRRFLTSTYRRVTFYADVNPPSFIPLMEWRVDGLGAVLGAELQSTFTRVGAHTISVGPLNRPIGVIIDTYSVSITSHNSGGDIVPQGVWTTFEAVTDPPGLEGRIEWVSSTKYGTAAPVLGRGRTFTVQFNDTFGFDEELGAPFEWLGVRADNALFGQDQKPAGACLLADNSCVQLTEAHCVLAGGIFSEVGLICDLIEDFFLCTPLQLLCDVPQKWVWCFDFFLDECWPTVVHNAGGVPVADLCDCFVAGGVPGGAIDHVGGGIIRPSPGEQIYCDGVGQGVDQDVDISASAADVVYTAGP